MGNVLVSQLSDIYWELGHWCLWPYISIVLVLPVIIYGVVSGNVARGTQIKLGVYDFKRGLRGGIGHFHGSSRYRTADFCMMRALKCLQTTLIKQLYLFLF